MRNMAKTLAGSAAIILTGVSLARAETIDIVVPFSAGGGTDMVARVFSPGFGKELGATAVIRNLAGASGSIGAGEVAKARPDGATLGYLPIGTVVIQPVLADTSYQVSDLTPICQTTATPMFLMVAKDTPWNSVDDVVEAGKNKRLIYGSSGPGTIVHLAMAAFAQDAGINALHLPFAGTGPAMNAMAGGEIQLFADTSTVLEGNDLKPLAIFAKSRSPEYPDVPTMDELGYPDLNFAVWQGVFGPKGLPADDVAKFSTACEKAVATETFKDFLQKSNTTLSYMDSETFSQFVEESQKSTKKLLVNIGLAQ